MGTLLTKDLIAMTAAELREHNRVNRVPTAELVALMPPRKHVDGEVTYTLGTRYTTKEEYDAALAMQTENIARFRAMSLEQKLALIRARSRMAHPT